MSSTLDYLAPSAPEPVPPLENGDHLTRPEFERRYSAMPGVKKAELIEGKVHMPSPVHHETHGRPHAAVVTWLGYYRAFTPGTDLGDNSSVRIDWHNEPQPDALLMLAPERGGQARVGASNFIEGAPELIVEVSASTISYDLHEKFQAYERNGVREYVVWRVLDRELDWFVLREGRYVPLSPDAEGILRSEVFPGLWLDPAALLAGDLARVFAVVQRGTTSIEHAAFIR